MKTRVFFIIPGRVWAYTHRPSLYSFRHTFFPWTGVDEYNRLTLVIPMPMIKIIIALWWFAPEAEDDPNPIWQRWKSVRKFGRLSKF